MLILFLFAIVLLIGAVFTFIKSDDTAFTKAQLDLREFRVEIQNGVKDLKANMEAGERSREELKGLIEKTFEDLNVKFQDQDNKVQAIDLELLRMKEKLNKINLRATPTTHTVRLEIIEPKKIEGSKKPLIPQELLQKSGIVKPKRKPTAQ